MPGRSGLAPGQEQALRQMSDETLMTHFQQGAVVAFDLLVERYRSALTHYMLRFLRDVQTSEDLVQETFARVYRNRHAYRAIARFSTWLFTIAANLARTEYRRRQRQQMFALHFAAGDDESFELDVPDEAPSPEDEAERALRYGYVQEALHKLPEEFWEVVVLRDVQELTYAEIGQITGLPMGTVKSRIHRGRTRLHQMLEGVLAT